MITGLTKLSKLHTTYGNIMTMEQILYVVGLMHNFKFPISSEGLVGLIEGDVIINNVLQENIKEAFQLVLDTKEVIEPKTNERFTEDTLEVYNDIASLFHDDISKDELEKYARFCSGDKDAAKVLYTFLSIMPSSSAVNNKKWNEALNTTYTGVTLRRLTTHTGKKFMKLYKKNDAGVMCLSLMLFVKDGVSKTGKCFVRKIDSYFSEFQDWYDTAKEKLEKLEAGTAATEVSEESTSGNGRRMI